MSELNYNSKYDCYAAEFRINNTKYALALGSVVSASEATFTSSKDAYAEGRMISYRRFNKDIK